MFGHTAKKLFKAFPFIVLASFVWIAIFAVGMGMDTNKQGNMSGCPFMVGQVNMCPMGVVEHIAKWQQIITVAPNPYTNITLLLFAGLAIFSILQLFHQSKILLSKPNIQFCKYKEPELRVSDPLLAAFSDGILNPRIYEFATF